MNHRIVTVKSTEEIESVALLAKQIWQQHFTPIIGAEQVAYMLKNFQSAAAIQQQITDGIVYFAIEENKQYVGYIALIFNTDQEKVMLSKLYLKQDIRGKGLGKALLNHAEKLAIQSNNPLLWLTVNRFNEETIAWYKRQNFIITDELKKDIGQGFYMDDFIMEKKLLEKE